MPGAQPDISILHSDAIPSTNEDIIGVTESAAMEFR